MRHATFTGILSAIFLICALIGLVRVMIAAVLVMLENDGLTEVIDRDLSDIPDLESAVHPTRPSRN